MGESPLRILFLWPDQLRRDLGGPKIVVELAEALQSQGCETTLYDPWTLPDGRDRSVSWAIRCRDFLRVQAGNYDVVDYDHGHLPFPRTDFPTTTVMVARSGLLSHHFTRIRIPDLSPWRDGLRRLIKGRAANERYSENRALAHRTCMEADLVNVANDRDRQELLESGLPPDKVHVFPFAINAGRQPLFAKLSAQVPERPKVAFVGTFDGRKGAREFPRIVNRILAGRSTVQFQLLGTKGSFQTAEQVRRFFPRACRGNLNIIPAYAPDELPRLLADCSIGLFPSYIEGFPFGILEMLAAALPVVAYDAPGAAMMLPPEYLVKSGDHVALADRVLNLLTDPERLLKARIWAQARAGDFQWSEIAARTARLYREERWRLPKANSPLPCH